MRDLVRIDRSERAKEKAKLYYCKFIPKGADLLGMIYRRDYTRGAAIRLDSGIICQYNAGIIRSVNI